MYLSRITHNGVPRLKLNNTLLPETHTLSSLLQLEQTALLELVASIEQSASEEDATQEVLVPVDAQHEIWASGVTYLRSRDARKLESQVADVYERVYDAQRPELFFKAIGWRAVGSNAHVRIRDDSNWNVPEAEVCLVINAHQQIVGYCAGNDMSSRQIEGENPLYLPQAKMYDGACALGPGIKLITPDDPGLNTLPVSVTITREQREVFHDETNTSTMKRSFDELVAYLFREMQFPQGVFLMTGTGIVPPESFSLRSGDEIVIRVGDLRLVNTVM